MNKPETNLLEQEPKRDLVPMRICAKPYIMSERIKSFPIGQTKHELNHYDFSLWSLNTENLETLLFYTEKLLCVKKEQAQKLVLKQLPAREGDRYHLSAQQLLKWKHSTLWSVVPLAMFLIWQWPTDHRRWSIIVKVWFVKVHISKRSSLCIKKNTWEPL